jgi:hypothetical protein
MGHRTQLFAQALHRCRRDSGAKVSRQLLAGNRFDHGQHVGGAAPGEIADHGFGCDRNPRARQLVRSNCGSDLFAVDQHTVAIKDDHGSLAPARSLRDHVGLLLFDESRLEQ